MKDLLKLYSFESVHGSEDEKAICDWVCKWLDAHKIKDYHRTGNNIYKKSKSNIVLSAHLDQVKTSGKLARIFMKNNGTIVGYNKYWCRTSLGADDKNGIWIILKALEVYGNDVSFIISEGEEVGLVGIHALESAGVLKTMLPEKNTICLVLDRKGNDEILDTGGSCKYCKTLAQDLCNFLGGSWKVGTGTCSDTQVLSEYCESVNMSVGYTGAHTSTEETDYISLNAIKNDVLSVIKSFVHYNTPVSVYKTSYSLEKSYAKFWK